MAKNGYKIGDTRDLGTCAACGNVIVIEAENGLFRPQRCGNPVKLQDGWLCGSCLRRLRVKYPQQYRRDSRPRLTEPYEPAGELPAEEACRELEQIHDHLEDLREKYGFLQAVFAVEQVDVKKAGLFKPPFITVTGHVLYGAFYSLDKVSVGAKGGQQATIACLYYPHSSTPISELQIDRMHNRLLIDYAWAEGGEVAAFVFQDKSLNLKPGDLIVKD